MDQTAENRRKGHNSVTNFQLSKFYRPESTDIKGFSKVVLLIGNKLFGRN